MKERAIVCLSGGLDSAANIEFAREHYDIVLALTFNYGQKAFAAEQKSAQYLCRQYGVDHKVLHLDFFKDFSSGLLAEGSLPLAENVQIDNLQVSQKTAQMVWVPNRNGIFLNIAAAYAEAYLAQVVIPGFNQEEATTFPDNSQSFIEALNQAFYYSTNGKVRVQCFTVKMNKTQIVNALCERKFDFSKLWICYQNGPRWCGECESCQRFARALHDNGLSFQELNTSDG